MSLDHILVFDSWIKSFLFWQVSKHFETSIFLQPSLWLSSLSTLWGKKFGQVEKKHCFHVVVTISKTDRFLNTALYLGHLFELQCTSLVLLQAMSYPAQYQPDVVVCNSCICSILLYWGKRILPFVLYQKVVGLAACTRCLVAAVVLYIYT